MRRVLDRGGRGGLRRPGSLFAGLCLGVATGCATTSPALIEPRAANPNEARLTVGGAALVPLDPVGDSDGVGHVVKPGLGTIVRASFGLGGRTEATLRYGGRDLGLGLRWNALESRSEQAGALALLLGIEARGRLAVRPDDAVVHRDDARGYGVVAPIGVAFQSDAGLVTAWGVAQFGLERVAGPFQRDADAPVLDLRLLRTFLAGQFGLGIGFRRVRVMAEIGVERDWVSGTVAGVDRSFAVTSLTPAFALSIRL